MYVKYILYMCAIYKYVPGKKKKSVCSPPFFLKCQRQSTLKDTSIIWPTFHAWLTALLWGAVTRQQQVAMVYGKGNVLTLWLRTECEQ